MVVSLVDSGGVDIVDERDGKILCPKCGSEMVLGKRKFKFGLVELYDTECMRCPKCGHEVYTKKQWKKVMQSLYSVDLELSGYG